MIDYGFMPETDQLVFMRERSHPAGWKEIQQLYKFKNGWGASIVGPNQFTFDSLELAVIKWAPGSNTKFARDYSTTVTSDVEREDESGMAKLLEAIAALPECPEVTK